jgi:hypothetical protein
LKKNFHFKKLAVYVVFDNLRINEQRSIEDLIKKKEGALNQTEIECFVDYATKLEKRREQVQKHEDNIGLNLPFSRPVEIIISIFPFECKVDMEDLKVTVCPSWVYSE